MLLKEKGSSAEIQVSADIKVSTKWSGDIDFDTAVLFEKKDKTRGIVYYGTNGDGETHGYVEKAPFIMLDKDSLSGGEENLVISAKAIEAYTKMYLVVWDYKAITGSKSPEFNTSDVKVHIGDHAEVHPQVSSQCNFVVMAVIQNDGGKISILNKSVEGTLTAVDDDAMWVIIDK